MLIMLLPEQVSQKWDMIKPAIKDVVGASNGSVDMNQVLMSMLDGRMQCWLSCRKEKDQLVIEGLITTEVLEDSHGNIRSLLIYSMYGYRMDRRSSWEGAFETLVRFAKGHECERIVTYTNVRSLISLMEQLGGDASKRFVSIPI